MEHFNYVVLTILPVFMVIGIGFVAVKWQLLPNNSHKALAAFVLNFGLPAAIFSALSSKSIDQIWHLDYVLIYTLGSLVIFSLVAVLSLYFLQKSPTESVILGLGGSFSNSLLIGFPIIYFLFKDRALAPFTLTLLVENLILLPLLLTLAEISSGKEKVSLTSRLKETANNLSKNQLCWRLAWGYWPR
ncbi:transporter [Vibrio ishigakensis]|uniref:Transporter n=1 Tax=Vibrio ishigakensis TaxID=1481914 RepID=A0A0B8P7R0_9VIBR|nr:transporter [Vibrio ishigakensis]